MTKRQDTLRAMRVFNTHEVLDTFGEKGVDDVACTYHAPARSTVSSGSKVYSPSHKTRPEAAWYDYGQKAFYGRRAETLPQAEAWASKKYNVKEWKPGPFGDRIPATVHARMMAAVKEASK